MKHRRFFISCGELSGETHAAALLDKLYRLDRSIKFQGFGSTILKELGVKLIEDYKEYSFSGFTEVVANLSKILSLKKRILEAIIEYKPEAVILVDYGALHLELAKSIKEYYAKHPKKKAPKIFHYIAPQIWASRPWRIKKIKKYVDQVLCTLPFEKTIYDKHSIPSTYVGNPVLASLSKTISKEEFLEKFYAAKYHKGQSLEKSSKSTDEILIGLFPGSRRAEIKFMLPIMLEAAKGLVQRNPDLKFKFILAKANTIPNSLLEKYGIQSPLAKALKPSKSKLSVEVLEPNDILYANHKLLAASDFLWLCSGTVTLEASLYSKAHFLAYKSTSINYMLYLIFRTINQAGLANIITGKSFVKEFLQFGANSENFIRETELSIKDPAYNEAFKEFGLELRTLLGDFNAPEMAAREIF